MQQVTEFEHMLYEDGVKIIKFWFSISKDEQQNRFASRAINPLKQWKLSPIDQEAQAMWDNYTSFKEKCLAKRILLLVRGLLSGQTIKNRHGSKVSAMCFRR